MRLLISFLRFFVVTSIYFSACDSVAENELAANVDVIRRTRLREFAEKAELGIWRKHLTAGTARCCNRHTDSNSHITGDLTSHINECRAGQMISPVHPGLSSGSGTAQVWPYATPKGRHSGRCPGPDGLPETGRPAPPPSRHGPTR